MTPTDQRLSAVAKNGNCYEASVGLSGLSPDGVSIFWPIAQRLEQATHNRFVHGSNPCGPTTFQLCPVPVLAEAMQRSLKTPHRSSVVFRESDGVASSCETRESNGLTERVVISAVTRSGPDSRGRAIQFAGREHRGSAYSGSDVGAVAQLSRDGSSLPANLHFMETGNEKQTGSGTAEQIQAEIKTLFANYRRDMAAVFSRLKSEETKSFLGLGLGRDVKPITKEEN